MILVSATRRLGELPRELGEPNSNVLPLSATHQRRPCSATRAQRGGAQTFSADAQSSTLNSKPFSAGAPERLLAGDGKALDEEAVCALTLETGSAMSSDALCTVVLSAEGQVWGADRRDV